MPGLILGGDSVTSAASTTDSEAEGKDWRDDIEPSPVGESRRRRRQREDAARQRMRDARLREERRREEEEEEQEEEQAQARGAGGGMGGGQRWADGSPDRPNELLAARGPVISVTGIQARGAIAYELQRQVVLDDRHRHSFFQSPGLKKDDTEGKDGKGE